MDIFCRPNDDSKLTGHGRGEGALVLEQRTECFPTLQVLFSRDDIRHPTDWRIHDSRHTLVVHLGGQMSSLETEMDGYGGSRGAALAGEVWSIPAGRHYASCARGGVIDYAVLYIDPDLPHQMNWGDGQILDLVPTAGKRDAFLYLVVRQLQELTVKPDDLGRLQAETLSQAAALHLMRNYRASDRESGKDRQDSFPRLNERTIKALRDYIADHLETGVRLADLATVAGLTSHHLLREFSRVFGTTPAQYVLEQRLRAAQRLIQYSPYDLTAIALMCGFSSHSHLTHTFRKRLGVTPSAFRAAPEFS